MDLPRAAVSGVSHVSTTTGVGMIVVVQGTKESVAGAAVAARPAIWGVGSDDPAPIAQPAGPTLAEAVAAYLDDCRQRNHSPVTLERYGQILGASGHGCRYWMGQGVLTVGELADGVLLRSFLLSLRDRGLRDSTQHTHFRTWHSCLVWCEEQGWLAACDRVFRVKPPRIAKREPAVLTATQEAYLLGAAHCERDRFIIRFMLRTGLRRNEVLRLDLDDLMPSRDAGYLIRVRQGKGGKDRRVPVDTGGSRFSEEIGRYIREVRPRTSCPALFVTRENLNGWGGLSARQRREAVRLTSHGLYQVFRRLRLETSIDVRPHMLRHTYATRAIAAGVPAFALQAALGHSTLEMTKRYVHYSTEHLEAAWGERKD